MTIHIFHGGCSGCTQQEINGIDFCVGCQYFNADWSLPNLNNSFTYTDEVKIEMKVKHGLKLSEREKFILSLKEKTK